MRERRSARATPAARTQAPIFAHARSSSSIVPYDGVVGDARARERARELRHAAGRAVGQPLAGAGAPVVQARRRLEPEQQHRRLGGLRDREHRARGRVGHRVADHQVDLGGREAVARLAAGLLAVDQAGRYHVAAELGDALLDAPLVALDALLQALELGSVGLQPDPEDPYARARRR